jgi:hypothetical protein
MSISLPSLIVQELAILMTPPAAITFLSVDSRRFNQFFAVHLQVVKSTSMHATYLLVMFRPYLRRQLSLHSVCLL